MEGRWKAFNPEPAGDLLRQESPLHYGLIWTLYCAGGDHCSDRGDLTLFRNLRCRGSFSPWRRNLDLLHALTRRMARRRPEICSSPSGIVPLLKGTNLPGTRAAANGVEGTFIVDTGAPSTLLSSAYARKAGVDFDGEVYREGRDGAGNRLRLYPGVVDRLDMGAATCTACPVLVADLAIDIAGILSPLELFRGQSVELDRKRDRLQIRWNGERPFVQVSVDGRAGWFLLDTGAGASLMCMGFAHGLGIDCEKAAEIESLTAAGKTRIRTGGRREFAVGDESAAPADFLIKACPHDPEDLFPGLMDGYVGTPWFQNSRVRFSEDRRGRR